MSTDTQTTTTTVQTDAELLKKIAMLEARVETREKQLKQAIDIANRANDEAKARETKEKEGLISSIQQDSKFTVEDLKDKSLSDLQTIRITLDRSIEKTFASVAAEIDEQKRSHQPQLTLGMYDSTKKTWVGGI
jgi:hypothetical protein